MPFKPNYRFERRERDRVKQAKKEEKLRRQQERNNPNFWFALPTESEEVARSVEKHFLELGMKNDPHTGRRPRYIYIF